MSVVFLYLRHTKLTMKILKPPLPLHNFPPRQEQISAIVGMECRNMGYQYHKSLLRGVQTIVNKISSFIFKTWIPINLIAKLLYNKCVCLLRIQFLSRLYHCFSIFDTDTYKRIQYFGYKTFFFNFLKSIMEKVKLNLYQ